MPDPNESFASKKETSNDSTNKGTEGESAKFILVFCGILLCFFVAFHFSFLRLERLHQPDSPPAAPLLPICGI